jgi:aspartyl-tRNA(Asn)/glutamyl-tRNA(Gln) amidotransferase subunit B
LLNEVRHAMKQETIWQPVIGLEIHVQLNTESKLFSAAPNRFGDEPNTNITDVCTGQPGSLPVLNEEAVKKAVQLGLALGSDIQLFSRFDRKSYFYPDSPRNYQITQFDHPILKGGSVEADVEGNILSFAVQKAHLEDDAGMLKHFTSFTGVDYNRAGNPLIEIVSEPCMRSAKEAVAYAMAIREILIYLGASDCNMEEGSMRIDANVSVKLRSETALRNKTEIKNMNSFSNMELAINAEIQRQIAFYTQNAEKIIPSGTYRFDIETQKTILMRLKEGAEDYRYFPEPDLLPLVLSKEYIAKIQEDLPELPRERFKRYITTLFLPAHTAETLVQDKALCDYFEKALTHCKNPVMLSNWLIVEFMGRLKEKNQTLQTSGLVCEHITALINLIHEGAITGKIAKSIADDMIIDPSLHPSTIIANNPSYKPLLDASSIETLVDEVLQANPESVTDYRMGKTRAYGFLVGQVMKRSNGTASPPIVNELLTKKLSA